MSETALAVFDDKSQGGTGPTSSLTQFVRSTAAYILGFQRFHQIKLAAISIQNELNFEQFYNSATYPLASQYVKAVKAVRIEFDKHPELKDIQSWDLKICWVVMLMACGSMAGLFIKTYSIFRQSNLIQQLQGPSVFIACMDMTTMELALPERIPAYGIGGTMVGIQDLHPGFPIK